MQFNNIVGFSFVMVGLIFFIGELINANSRVLSYLHVGKRNLGTKVKKKKKYTESNVSCMGMTSMIIIFSKLNPKGHQVVL